MCSRSAPPHRSRATPSNPLQSFTSGALPMHMSKTVAQLVARLTDAFESLADDPSAQDQAANAGPSALAECVPLLAVVVELINRGPTALTIEGVESYRTRIASRASRPT